MFISLFELSTRFYLKKAVIGYKKTLFNLPRDALLKYAYQAKAVQERNLNFVDTSF